ncbi:MAG TPA: signal peptidase I [Acidimicrobiia bacterium]|nr:signal peptidase I [Acidimicrobiia bacterium]
MAPDPIGLVLTTTDTDASDEPVDDNVDAAPVAPKPRRSALKIALEWGTLAAAAIIIAILVKAFLFEAFYIPSPSMEPTLQVHDRVLVNKLSYHLHDVHRGDIVVFKRPPKVSPQYKDLVKRVVGLPGDVVSFRQGYVYINGKRLEEKYLPPSVLGHTDANGAPPRQTIPANSYFVMGDNREHSEDSRVFGPIPKSSIVGRVFIRIWPLNRLDLL